LEVGYIWFKGYLNLLRWSSGTQLVTSDCSVSGIENLTKTKERNWLTPGLALLWDKTDMVKVFEVCPLDRQLLNNRTPEGNKTRYDNTTKVVLRRVTYFLVGCIRFIDVMALGSLSLSSCCWERSACEKTAQLLAKYIHDKKWKGKCKPLEFGTDFADTATSLLVHPEASRVSFQLLIPPTNTAEAQNRLGNHSKPSSLCCLSLCIRGQRTGKRKSGAWKRSRGQ